MKAFNRCSLLIGFLSFSFWKCERGGERMRICFPIDEGDTLLTATIRPVRCKGPIVDVQYKSFSMPKGSYTFAYINPLEEFGFIGQPLETTEVKFRDSTMARLGLWGHFEDRISIGDTFLKREGEAYFYFLKPNGDTICAEMNSIYNMEGNDWTFEVDQSMHCYWRRGA